MIDKGRKRERNEREIDREMSLDKKDRENDRANKGE